MGGAASRETPGEEGEEEAEEGDAEEGDAEEGDAEAAASEDAPGELPQCNMGNRKVDNMCFMVSCTNWY